MSTVIKLPRYTNEEQEDSEDSNDNMVVLDEELLSELLNSINDDSEMESARRDLLGFLEEIDEGEEVERGKLEELLDYFVDQLPAPDNLSKRILEQL